jgi:hypothetical protein
MGNNQKDESPLRRTEADQKSTKPKEPVESDSQASDEPPEPQPAPGGRPDLVWTDHED